MSNTVAEQDFTITFANDMPVAAVEVVDSEMRKVGNALMRNGQERRVELSGAPRFLRIHMPDGRLVTVAVDGDSVQVAREDIDPASRRRPVRRPLGAPPSLKVPAGVHESSEVTAAVFENRNVPARRHFDWEWSLDGGKRVRDELQWVFAGESPQAFNLIGTFGKNRVCMRIPGNVRRVDIDTTVTWPAPAAVKVRLHSRTQLLNTLTAFLQHSDMIATRDAITELLAAGAPKITDPFAGCVLAYLLLRLRRFDDAAMQVFSAVADSDAPDGAIIAAWRALVLTPERVDVVERLLAEAIERGIPVYTEGTRLLIDGLLALGETGAARLAEFRSKIGHVMWRSPVTTMVFQADSPVTLPRVSVAFES